MRVLIVEDEKKTAQDLAATIKNLRPNAEVVGICDSIESTVALLRNQPTPDLIFMDIHLADGSCFEIFKEIEINNPVIFCTSYDQYAIEAFKKNGLGYILKPFYPSSVAEAFQKYEKLGEFYKTQKKVEDSVAQMSAGQAPKYLSSLLVGLRDKFIPIATDDVAFFSIEHEIAFLRTFDDRRFVVEQTLEELENKLDPSKFFRANRQHLINFKAIQSVESSSARKLLIKLKSETKETVLVSKAKASGFLSWMKRK